MKLAESLGRVLCAYCFGYVVSAAAHVGKLYSHLEAAIIMRLHCLERDEPMRNAEFIALGSTINLDNGKIFIFD